MNKAIERENARQEARYLREKVARLQREIADWPMTAEREAEKRAELRAIRVELLGVMGR